MLVRLLAFAVLVATLAVSIEARAQDLDGYRAERFRPPPSAGDALGVPLPATVGDLVPAFGLVVDYAHRPLVARPSEGGADGAIVSHRVMTHVIAAVGITDRLELHLRAPVVVQAGDAPMIADVAFAAPDVVSVADGVLGGSVRLLGDGAQGFHLGVTGEVLFPFANPTGHVSDREVSARGLLTASVTLPSMTLALAAGASYRPERSLLGSGRSASELDLAAALIVPAFFRTDVMVELYVSSGLREGLLFQTRGTSMELVVGARHKLVEGFAFELGAAVGFLRAPGTAAFRVFAGARWELAPAPPADPDGDGLFGDEDACPLEAEDRDQFHDDDGCPDPDDDGDGIPDARDGCPRQAEDLDGWDDDDGCPDPDDDEDGWADTEDACPRVPGGDSRRGCPRTVRTEGAHIELLEEIRFVEGTAQLVPTNGMILDEVAAVMRMERTLVRWQITARPVPTSRRDDGLELASARQRAVAAALIARSVPAARLVLADPAAVAAEEAARAGGVAASSSAPLVTLSVVRPPSLSSQEAR